jgi:hypothetical protein
MIHDHKFYELQGALAATGQLTDKELEDLELHATSCASCRNCIEDMAEMSRMVFLVQPKTKNRRGTPEGMQQRFIERAAGAGISVGSVYPLRLDLRFIGIAAIAVLLTIASSVSWKLFLVRDAGRKLAPASSIASFQPGPASRVISHVAEAQTIYDTSKEKVQLRRRSTAQLAAFRQLPNHGSVTERPPCFEPKRLLSAAQEPRLGFPDGFGLWPQASVAGGHGLIRTSLTKEYFAYCWEQGQGCRPGERAFHLDMKLASSALLNSTQSVNEQGYVKSLKFTPPAFHLDPARAW